MVKKNSTFFVLVLFVIWGALSLITTSSCAPQRRGHTVGQMGGGGKGKFHRTPASAKVKRMSKY
ncbi:MAG: hypothetical protein IT232_04635 [Flavobacteriales bacterium]|nr:hypothetical protein [Flavobacteriales bacterium]